MKHRCLYNTKACKTSEPTIIQNTWVQKNPTTSEKQGLQNTNWGLGKNEEWGVYY